MRRENTNQVAFIVKGRLELSSICGGQIENPGAHITPFTSAHLMPSLRDFSLLS